MTKHDINVDHQWFQAIAEKKKTVEGRLNRGKFANIRIGDVLRIISNGSGDAVEATVMAVRYYDSFSRYLREEGLTMTLPGVKSLKDGVNIYYKYYSPMEEKEHGVAAIEIELN